MRTLKYFLSVVLLSFSFLTIAQTFVYKGVVIDKQKKQSLAFVNIVSNNGIGTTTDIDGKFELRLTSNSKTLNFSYIGYEPLSIEIDDKENLHKIYLQAKTFNLDEVEILPGINPAHRIIDSVLAFRDENDPEKIKQFTYVSYDKMNIGVDADSLRKQDLSDLDSNQRKVREFVDKQDIFLLETVTERKYLAPGLNQETVLATRVSGLKDPVMAFMISQLQSTSFYSPQINILGQKYINPISRGSKNKYFFLIEDTTYTERGDTVFMISFRPKINTRFSGMKGFLYINSYKWALQNVKASPPDDSTGIGIKIQQAYKLVDNQWFPYQLNTDIIFNNMMASDGETSYPLVGKGRSYIKDINLNPGLKKSQFGYHEVEIEEDATRKKGEFWKEYRVDSLTDREKETYRVIDSIGKEANFDKMATTFQTLMVGKIPFKFIDIDLDKIIHYNNYEGLYLGLGLHTNSLFSKTIKTGGYWGYGFKDKSAKYGLDLSIKLHKRSESVLRFDYYNSVTASGDVEFFDDKMQAWKSDYFYKYFISRMNKTHGLSASYSFRLRVLRDFKWNLQADYFNKKAFGDYFFTNDVFTQGINEFSIARGQIGFRFAFREKVIETTKGQISFGSKYPIVWFNYSHGIEAGGGDFSFDKFDLKVRKTHSINYLGEFTWQLNAGIISGSMPASELYNTNGSFRTFTLYAPYSFATMRVNEFLSDRYVSLFMTHDFTDLLFEFGKFKPQLLLVTNIAFGDLHIPENHHNYDFKTLDKGYYESGIIIRKLLNLRVYDLGLGVMYRYGPYSFNDNYKNFAYKLSLFYGF